MITIKNKKHWVEEQAENIPNKISIVTQSKSLSYKELYKECLFTSQYMHNLGIVEGDHIGILSSHNYRFFVTVNALWIIGAVPIPLNTRNTSEELKRQIKQADIKYLIIDKILNSQFSTCLPAGKVLNSKLKIDILINPKFKVQNLKSNIRYSKFNIRRSALMIFTSGSSGKSKLVVHTFKSLFESAKATDSFANLSSSDIWFASLPFYHIGGFMILYRALLTGSAIAFPKSLSQNDIRLGLKIFNPTHISIVPTTLLRLIEKKIKPNPNLKFVFLGGGPSDDQLSINAVLKRWPIVKVYGSSETCSMITALYPSELKQHALSSGKPIGKAMIKIKSKSKKNITGEIVVKSKSLFKKYYNDPRSTNNKLKMNWYHTGDYGWIDDEGYLFVDSRREDLIITGGENVSVKEIESTMKTHKKIKDVVAFGSSDKTWGQIVCAAIVSNKLTEKEINIFLKDKIAGYKIPKRFYFMKSIPRNEMGKVERNKLFKMLMLN